MEHEQTMKVGQAADLLGVTPRTISNWANKGEIECRRTLGGHRRPLVSSVLALCERLGITESSEEADIL